jgi:hypothetical protein
MEFAEQRCPDKPIPIVRDLVTEMPQQRAVRLLHFMTLALAPRSFARRARSGHWRARLRRVWRLARRREKIKGQAALGILGLR